MLLGTPGLICRGVLGGGERPSHVNVGEENVLRRHLTDGFQNVFPSKRLKVCLLDSLTE